MCGQPGCPGDMCWDAPTKDAGDATFCSVYLWAGSQTKPLFFPAAHTRNEVKPKKNNMMFCSPLTWNSLK